MMPPSNIKLLGGVSGLGGHGLGLSQGTGPKAVNNLSIRKPAGTTSGISDYQVGGGSPGQHAYGAIHNIFQKIEDQSSPNRQPPSSQTLNNDLNAELQ